MFLLVLFVLWFDVDFCFCSLSSDKKGESERNKKKSHPGAIERTLKAVTPEYSYRHNENKSVSVKVYRFSSHMILQDRAFSMPAFSPVSF